MCRAAWEQSRSKATWFFTFTYGPLARANILSRAHALEDGRRSQSERLCRAAGTYVAAYMRRLRKGGLRVKYLAVPEPHRDGFPHWHGLVHDLDGNADWETLTHGWSHGWSVFKIVRDVGAIGYVTKYIAKERYGRIRASIKYGDREASFDGAARAIEPEGVGKVYLIQGNVK